MMPYLLRAPLAMALSALLAATCVPAPPAAAASAREVVLAPRVPAGTTASYMVFDRTTGKATLAYKVHSRFRSASVVKILIALDYLESRKAGTSIPAADRDLLKRMLRSSDDDAATAFWRRGGQRAIVDRVVRRIGLKDSGPPPASRPGFWGYTALSASDVVLTYRYLLDKARPEVRDLILGHLRHATRCATDHFDQYFGIPSAVPRPWAVKQGWSGYGSTPAVRCGATRASTSPASTSATGVSAATGAAGRPPVNLARPVLHTTGLTGEGDRLIVVVLTLQPAGASFAGSAARLTALTRDVHRAGRPR
ncbi:hypothetical protein [Sphaerisporangium perillae]|uniref:hypothetical protein n=1 Tax=Sphaerisporangium perillae TaxID=2935860 RepID=UPI00200CD545|nr:hypothetical protein [Sphaerisporangium perillae]